MILGLVFVGGFLGAFVGVIASRVASAWMVSRAFRVAAAAMKGRPETTQHGG